MSKKTCYTLSRIALAAALASASTFASAANCSTKYCFVDGVMKWSTSQDIEASNDIYAVSMSKISGSTTDFQIGPIGDQGYTTKFLINPITQVTFSASGRVLSATSFGSGLAYTRGAKTSKMKNITVRLQSTPDIVSIHTDFEGAGTPIKNMPTFWNLYNDGAETNGPTFGNGSISLTPEPDGFYHSRVTIPYFNLVGDYTRQIPPYSTAALREWLAGLGMNIWAFALTQQWLSHGTMELDMRFTAIKP